MSYYTNKPSVYHEGNFIVRNYTEDQAGMDIRKEDVVQARNGWYYTSQEIETWKVKNTQDMPTYGNCRRCGQGGTDRYGMLTVRGKASHERRGSHRRR